MAVVGLTWDDCNKRCPPDVQIACHNSKDNVTISGPRESVQKFVEELSSENILAKHFDTDGVAYHSKYISSAAPLLLERIKNVIPQPKPRSQKWVSTSTHKQSGSDVCDAAYFVNNLLSPVRFEEAMRAVPDNALLVEIAPVALLQNIIKRQKPNALHLTLLRDDASDSLEQLLTAVGRLYGAGAQPQLTSLYPTRTWPVSRSTPGLASRVLWDHSVEYDVPKFKNERRSDDTIAYDLSKPDDSFIAGHNIDGRVLFPGTGYLVLIWRTLAKLHNSTIEETPIIFENVQFKRPIVMPTSGLVEFTVTILKNSGDFEVSEGEGAIVTGQVRLAKSRLEDKVSSNSLPSESSISLNTDDIYKEFRVRGFYYSGIFCGIKSCDIKTSSGILEWNNNWVAFLDTMLQFKIIGTETKQLHVLTSLRYAFIDPKTHLNSLSAGKTLPVVVREEIDAISSPGVEFHGLKTRVIPRLTKPQLLPVIEKYNFYPYDNNNLDSTLKIQDALSMMLQTITENLEYAANVKMIEFVYGSDSDLMLQELSSILPYLTRHRFDVSVSVDTKQNQGVNSLNIENFKVILTKDLPCTNEYQIVMSKNILTQPMAENYLKSLSFALIDSGMILLQEPVGTYEIDVTRNLIEKYKLILVSKLKTVDSDLLLLRRKPTVNIDSVIIEVKDESYDWIDPLREALKKANNNRRVYAISKSSKNGLIGFGKALRTEPIGRALRIYFLPNAKEPFSLKSSFYIDQIEKDLYTNVLQEGTWGSYNHFIVRDISLQSVQTDSAHVKILTTGDLSSLTWVENNLHIPSVEKCYVRYASLNFHDIMLATGKLYEASDNMNLDDQDCQIGLEYSGVMLDGKRVMGIIPGRGLATTLRVNTDFFWEVPNDWTLEEAATVPVAYGTAYYALVVRGRMRRGESVLVHAGSGGVGQAAIAIALHAGCTVFTTVGTADKRAFLLERFPALCPDNIGNSRDTSFEQLVRRRTLGRGVDLVLNSLAGDQLMASVRCLAPTGRFLEIGRFDITEDTNLGMSMFLNNTTFHGIMLKDLFGSVERHAVVRCVREGVASGVVTPLAREVFNTQQVEQAFRHMAAGKHIGKVMIRVREENGPPTKIPALPQPHIHPDKFYVIIGGCGGFGLELAHWLVSCGARYLLLQSRRAHRTTYQTWSIQRLRSRGAQVIIDTRDCTTEDAARSLLQEVSEIAPIGAIFNLAMVLKDRAFENQNPETFDMVCRPKINVTATLDVASRELAPHLEFFVVFSSITCGHGNYGQTNYSYANSAMERIIEQRRRDNLPGLAIQWGVIGDVGAALDLLKSDTNLTGMGVQSITSCLHTLAGLLTQHNPVVTSWVQPQRQAATVTRQDVGPVISNILGVSHTGKFSKTTFEQLGIDSLVSAEIKRTLERQYNLILEIKEIHALTFDKLQEMVSGPKEVSSSLDIPVCGDRELVPKSIVVRLPSIEVSGNVRPVFMVHPIEGVATPFRDIAANIRAPVFGLQCADVPTTSLADLAGCYVKQIRAMADPPYTVLGYSYGAAIAFEMAYQLEQVAGCIRSAYNWEERVNATVDLLKNKTPFPADEIKMAVNRFREMTKIMDEYDLNKRLKGHVTLLTASQNYVRVDDDYGLREMCSGLDRRQLQASHRSIVTGESARAIAECVNEILNSSV
ncbi:fatty acid synthase-like [Aricia agestis]|uniref:fatty acid synthase-like n=1 Tax=Aricia agestis TaxID=91739 RepID=UPI001C20AA39|nr:fatty acid synthase-like [Aricia agestis]